MRMGGTVGFIGLGVMGKPMAINLVRAGFDVLAYNRSPGAHTDVAAAGGRVATSAAAVAAESTTVITMLPDDDAVRAVLDGEDGMLAHIERGSLVIDMSTVSPQLSRELAWKAASRDVEMLDAPVSGGDIGARDGTLVIMVGGDAGAFARGTTMLEVLGSRVIHVGPAGAGQAAKACNQVLVATTLAAVSEALVFGEKLGVDPELLLDVLSSGLAANRVMEVRRRNFLDRDFAPGFRVDLHHKDLRIALGAAGEVHAPLPLASLVQQMFSQLRAMGRGDADHSSLLLVAEAAAAARGSRPKPLDVVDAAALSGATPTP